MPGFHPFSLQSNEKITIKNRKMLDKVSVTHFRKKIKMRGNAKDKFFKSVRLKVIFGPQF